MVPYKQKQKACSRCKEVKPITEFYSCGRRGFSALCRVCAKAHSKKQADIGYFRDRRKALRGDSKVVRLDALAKLARELHANARKRSINSGWEPWVSLEYVESAVREFAENNFYEIEKRSPFKPSLDRIDSYGTYAESNVRVVWLIENCARSCFTDAQVLEFCKRKLGLQVA